MSVSISNTNVLPELANKYDAAKHEIRGWYMSEKLDGVRAWWIDGKLFSREGNWFRAPEWFISKFPKDIVLDGELYMGKGNFQSCVGTVKRHQPTDEWNNIEFVVFDAPYILSHFEERIRVARSAIENVTITTTTHDKESSSSKNYIRLLDQVLCTGADHANDMLLQIEEYGGEGVMLRHPTALYNPSGKRTSNVLKIKTMHDAEALVIGHEPGKGKHQGRLGALLCTIHEPVSKNTKPKTFKIGSGFTDVERENPPEIGSIVTYRYFELTKGGIPRFPVFHRMYNI